MSNQAFYWTLLVLAFVYVMVRGSAPERLAMSAWTLASLLSTAAVVSGLGAYETLQFGVFAVDIALLVFLIWLALRADRFWPLWVTGFHLLGVMTHIAKAITPDLHPWAYAVGQSIGGYLIIGAIVAGTARQHRRAAAAAKLSLLVSSTPSPPTKPASGLEN
jgi:hypothetical protein